MVTSNQPPKFFSQLTVDFKASLISGIVLASLFNPWDRALYLSVKERRPFLTRSNFTSPYQGFLQAAFHRVVSGGSYFFLQAQVSSFLLHRSSLDHSTLTFSALNGALAGMINGVLVNSLASIKYNCWNHPGNTFWLTSIRMWRDGGPKQFFRGSIMTGTRDLFFGVTYECSRRYVLKFLTRRKDSSSFPVGTITVGHYQPSEWLFMISNIAGGGVATIISSPFNYVRNMKFSVSDPPSSVSIFKQLIREAHNYSYEMTSHAPSSPSSVGFSSHHSHSTLPKRLFYLLKYCEQRLCIGWGTVRVAVGMGVGQLAFDKTKTFFSSSSSSLSYSSSS